MSAPKTCKRCGWVKPRVDVSFISTNEKGKAALFELAKTGGVALEVTLHCPGCGQKSHAAGTPEEATLSIIPASEVPS